MKKKVKNELSNSAALLGRKGGSAVVKKYGKSHMGELGKLGAAKRWGDNHENKK